MNNKNSKSILVAVISGVLVCALCITVILLIPTKKSDNSNEVYPDYYDNELYYDEDIIGEAKDYQEYLDEFFDGVESYSSEYSDEDDEDEDYEDEDDYVYYEDSSYLYGNQ